jgi:thiopeptide-type bacteriocin biosynthesis protein
LVIPFVQQREEGRLKDEGKRITRETKGVLTQDPSSVNLHPSRSIARRYLPGSEWLYAKLYTGTAIADQVLRDLVRPLTEEVIQSGAADSWFFIRYGDPDWHLRLRFHGVPERLHRETLPALQAAVAPLLEDGLLWRMQLDTYEREVERYGGPEGIQLAERLFHVDSETVLETMEMLEPGDTGLDERWRLALRGMHMILNDLGFDLEARYLLLTNVRKAFAKEFRADEHFIGQLGDRFRKERKNLEALLDPARDAENSLWPGIEVLQRRSLQWASTMIELKAGAQAGRLSVPLTELAASYMHMHANRLLRSAQRAQEMVIYDFLARLYESQLARMTKKRTMVMR